MKYFLNFKEKNLNKKLKDKMMLIFMVNRKLTVMNKAGYKEFQNKNALH